MPDDPRITHAAWSCTWDPRTDRIVFADDVTGAFGGAAPATWAEWLVLVHDDDREVVGSAVRSCSAGTCSGFSVELRWRQHNGAYRWFAAMGKAAERYADGRPCTVLILFSDVTERVQETSRYRRFVEHSTDVIWTVDRELGFTYVSPSVEQLRGLTPEQALQEPLADTMTHESLARCLELHARSLEEPPGDDAWVRVEVEQTCRDGSTVWVEASIQQLFDDEGKHVGYIGLSRDMSERRRAADALAASERRYRQMFDAARDAMFLSEDPLHAAGLLIDANHAAGELLGYLPDRLAAIRWPELWTHTETQQAMSRVRALSDDANVTFESKLLTADGHEVSVEVAMRYVDLDGRAALLTVARDITERELARRQLERREATIRGILDAAPIGIGVVDKRVLGWSNHRLQEMLGYTGEEIDGMPARRLYASEEEYIRVARVKHPAVTQRGFGSVETIMVRKDGTEFSALLSSAGVTPFTIEDGLIYTVTDITDRKAAEAALRESERAMSTLLANLPGMAYRCRNDLAWTMEFLSEGCRRVTEYEVSEVLSNACLSYEEIVLPEDRAKVRDAVALGIERDEPFEIEYRIRTKGGEERWVLERGVAVRNASGEVTALEGLVTDITQRKLLQAQYLRAQRMEAVGQLAGGIAHDFNNMLQVMNSCCSFLEDDLPPDEGLRSTLAELIEAERRAESLVRQLLAFSRRQVLEPRDVDVNDLVGNLLKMIGRVIGEHIRLEFVRGHALTTARLDPSQIEQALMNLCVNARDAMPEGGTLVIETASVRVDSSRDDVAAGTYVQIVVRDDGEGMDEATQRRIFEPFFTTKELGKGTGLGLATVYGIVRQHGGRIDVSSAPGQGTTFCMLLPAADGPGDVEPTPVRVRQPGGTETILLAEDEDLVRRSAERVLSRAGYRVLAARDGTEALALFEQEGSNIDVFVLDVVMPGLGGRQVHDRIRAANRRARVTFTSGYTDTSVHDGFVLEPGLRLLQKPYLREQLLAQVRAVLDEATEDSY